MPLFMFLSGYVSCRSFDNSFLSMVSKKVVQLFIPMAIYCLISWLMKNLLGLNVIDNFLLLAKNLVLEFLYGYWFIWTLFECFVILKIVLDFSNKIHINQNVLVGTSILLVLLIPNIKYILNADYLKCMYPFFCMGYLLKKNEFVYKYIYNRGGYFLLFLAIYLFFTFYTTDFSFMYMLKLDLFIDSSTGNLGWNYVNLFVLFVVGMSGIFVLFYIGNELLKNREFAFIQDVGKYTLSIYLLQGIIFNAFFTKYQFFLHNNLIYFCISVVLLLLCYYSLRFAEYSNITAFLFLGKKIK